MKIKILNEKPLRYMSYPITHDMIEIPDEEAKLLFSGRPCMLVDGHIVIDDEEEKKDGYKALKDTLRKQREKECFPYVNRGSIWYTRLTEEQYDEVNLWYQKWLDVTETLVAPEKPEWLK